MKKLTKEFVRSQFEKEGYKLLSKRYVNAHSKLNYVCSKNHKHNISWTEWQAGNRCPYCSNKIKKTIEFIEKEFENEKYILLPVKYKNAHQKLDYICPNGHKHSISWGSWSSGRRCPYCAKRPLITIEFINKKFEREGYELLTKVYKNAHQKLEYICPNRHKHQINWNNWRTGKRCRTCHTFNCRAENHPSWKGGISCEPYCFEWSFKGFKDMIKERDGNKCLNPDCWGNIHRLSVHHVDYNKKNCAPENLITLCASCNSRANKDREWHEAWYNTIIWARYFKGKENSSFDWR